MASTAWLTKSPGWEPLIAFVGFLGALVAQEVTDANKPTLASDRRNHDNALFEKYSAILSEDELLYILNNDLWNLRTDMGFVGKLGNLLHLASLTEGHYLDVKLDKVFFDTIEKMEALRTFLAMHFFVPHEGNTKNSEGELRLYLYPDLKYSDDQQKRKLYADSEKQLHLLIDEVIASYQRYRQRIKKTLYK